MKKLIRIGSLAVSAALLIAGCGAPPEAAAPEVIVEPTETITAPAEGGETAHETVTPVEGLLPCIAAQGDGGFEDRSFNQSAMEGLTQATTELGITDFRQTVSPDESALVDHLEEFVAQGCTLIVATGFQFAPALAQVAEAHPDVHFLMVDADIQPPLPNVKTVLFNTAEASFLAGYVAAAYSSREGGANHVGTFGGAQIPTVTDFMNGFRQGVEYYNETNGTDVRVTGMESFTGGFAQGPEATAIAQGLVDQGVDVILPVGGAIFLSAVTVIEGADRPIALIGVDQDIFYSEPTTQDMVLTSILKHVNVAVHDAVKMSATGAWDNTPYFGNLENGGVGIAPFHNFEAQIPADVQANIARLSQDIAAGTVHVQSDVAPN